MAVVEVSVVPLGTGETSLSKYVARAVQVLQSEKDVKYELTAMGTIIEGELKHVLAAVRKMHEAVFEFGAMRVITTIKIDDRRDKSSTAAGKVESVKKGLEEKD